MQFIGLAKQFEEQHKFANLLVGALKSADPKCYEKHKSAIEGAEGNPFALITLMDRIFPSSTTAVRALESMGARREADPPRDSAAADAVMKSLAAQYPAFYNSRERLLGSVASFCCNIATDEGLKSFGLKMVDNFAQTIRQPHHNINPFEALVFSVIMTSFADVNGKYVPRPQMLLFLCQAIANRAEAADVYATFNWLNITPDNVYQQLLGGIRPPMRPDQRTIDIGNEVVRITSFPLMPDFWGLESWNTVQLAMVSGRQSSFGNAAASSPAGLSSGPLQPFPVFRPSSLASLASNPTLNRTSDHAPADNNLTKVNEALVSGGSSTHEALEEALSNLGPLGIFVSAILADPSAASAVKAAYATVAKAVKNQQPKQQNRKGRKWM